MSTAQAPIVDPAALIQFSVDDVPRPASGKIGVVMWFVIWEDGILCSDWSLVDTAP